MKFTLWFCGLLVGFNKAALNIIIDETHKDRYDECFFVRVCALRQTFTSENRPKLQWIDKRLKKFDLIMTLFIKILQKQDIVKF